MTDSNRSNLPVLLRRQSWLLRLAKCWLVLLWFSSAVAAAERKLAVLGDSISTGAHAKTPAENGYPARLKYLFAQEYEVRSFARSSLCLLRKADLPFAATAEFHAALDWTPDVVTIMLGTNDTIDNPRPNWQHHADLAADTLFLIRSFQQRNADAVVHLLGPPPMSPQQGKSPDRVAQLKERVTRLQEIAETYRQVAAQEERVYYHDLARSFQSTSDGVHPETFGHESLGRELYERMSMPYDEAFDVGDRLQLAGVETEVDRWHGFRRFKFKQGPADCYLVAPHQAADIHPWIWRARFFGHQPALDLSLLDRGYHVAYCDVANLYGNHEALDRWDKFYDFATQELSLSSRPILEGMSRGGLPIFHWASKNPGQVSAIYGDNPVCNSLSWPGGNSGKRSDADWSRLLKAYQISEAETDRLPQPQQQQILQPISAAKIPVALVLGLADEVVPPEENGLPLARKYQQLGGPIKIWRKPGAGHHPHGLHPPNALRRWLLASTGHSFNPATRSVPSVEYRAGAGWGSDWRTAFEHLKKSVKQNPDSQLVFLGDSITQGLTGHSDRVAQPGGKRAIDRYFGERQALSLGLSGDRTEHVLWRLENGQLAGLAPADIVLMIGVNNINSGGHTGEETAAGTAAIVAWLRKHLPDARLILMGCFPAGHQPTDPRRVEVELLHQGIAPLADGDRVRYVDLRPLFLEPDGTLNKNMSQDAIHITSQGQAVWLQAISEIVNNR